MTCSTVLRPLSWVSVLYELEFLTDLSVDKGNSFHYEY